MSARQLLWTIITAPLWIWQRGPRRAAITILMWKVPIKWRGKRFVQLSRWFMKRWHPAITRRDS
jgi:hypothetical protein